MDIKNVNFLQKFQTFGDTLKLTFISDFRKFVMGLALFCDEVDEKNWWHFYFYLNAQLLPVEQIDMTIFPKIVPPYSIICFFLLFANFTKFLILMRNSISDAVLESRLIFFVTLFLVKLMFQSLNCLSATNIAAI